MYSPFVTFWYYFPNSKYKVTWQLFFMKSKLPRYMTIGDLASTISFQNTFETQKFDVGLQIRMKCWSRHSFVRISSFHVVAGSAQKVKHFILQMFSINDIGILKFHAFVVTFQARVRTPTGVNSSWATVEVSVSVPPLLSWHFLTKRSWEIHATFLTVANNYEVKNIRVV